MENWFILNYPDKDSLMTSKNFRLKFRKWFLIKTNDEPEHTSRLCVIVQDQNLLLDMIWEMSVPLLWLKNIIFMIYKLMMLFIIPGPARLASRRR